MYENYRNQFDVVIASDLDNIICLQELNKNLAQLSETIWFVQLTCPATPEVMEYSVIVM